MRDGRETDDMRLQRLADLSIEIRMLKARVQAALDEQLHGDTAVPAREVKVMTFRPSTSGASCPHCGHTAGLALLPREYQRLSTPVRCFACQREASAFDWTVMKRNAAPRIAST